MTDITVHELIQMRNALASRLGTKIAVELAAFFNDTGVAVSGLSISLHPFVDSSSATTQYSVGHPIIRLDIEENQ